MGPDNTLFEVYLCPRSNQYFGVSNAAGEWVLVEMVNGGYKRKRVSAVNGVTALGKKLKSGYLATKGRRYFSERSGTFTTMHPDLPNGWLLAVAPPDVKQCVERVTEIVRPLPNTVIFVEEIDAWAAEQQKHSEYVVASDDVCLWSLVLAQASLNEGWPMRWNGGGTIPREPPSVAPLEWTEWMEKHFSRNTVLDAQRALGWTFERKLTSVENTPDGGVNLAALF